MKSLMLERKMKKKESERKYTRRFFFFFFQSVMWLHSESIKEIKHI